MKSYLSTQISILWNSFSLNNSFWFYFLLFPDDSNGCEISYKGTVGYILKLFCFFVFCCLFYCCFSQIACLFDWLIDSTKKDSPLLCVPPWFDNIRKGQNSDVFNLFALFSQAKGNKSHMLTSLAYNPWYWTAVTNANSFHFSSMGQNELVKCLYRLVNIPYTVLVLITKFFVVKYHVF